MAANAYRPIDLGRLEHRDGQVVIRFTRRFPQPPRVVWQMLTEPEHLAAWFPTTIEGDRAAGAPLQFDFREGGGESFEGEMVVFDPPSAMAFRWGDEVLRFEIEPQGDGSVLNFSAAFSELGKAARDGAGWHACLDIVGYEAAGQAAPWSSVDRWKEMRAAYIEAFGPEASTIGPPGE